MFDSGISRYIKAQTTVTVYFPVDSKGVAYINCSQCEYYRMNAHRCGLTGKVSAFPEKFVGGGCPLEVTGDEENDV